MTAEIVRDRAERKADALRLIESEVDAWVASAMEDGRGYLVPLSYYWDGERLTMAANPRSPTARNLARTGWARLAIGPTRDVVIIDGPVEILPVEGHDELAAVHAEAAGFDARGNDPSYVFLRVTPETLQAWRNAAELKGRYVMRDGAWLD